MPRQFDTLKISFPTLYLDKDESKFVEDTDKKGKTVYLLKQAELQKTVGLQSLRIGATETAVEISAKILKENYPLLLSKYTIWEALDNIINLNIIYFEVGEILNVAHVLKAHPAKHLKLTRWPEIAALLTDLHTNTNYFLANPKGKNETVTFLQNVDTMKHRECFKLYGKGIEYRLSKNAGYRETLTSTQKYNVSEFFNNDIVKPETELNSKRKLRQYYPNIPPEIWLKDLLLSEADPVAAQFEKITKGIYKVLENKEMEKGNEFIKLLKFEERLLLNTLEKYSYDLCRVRDLLKVTLSPRTAQRRMRDFEALLQRYKAHEVTGEAKALLNELRAQISAPTSIHYNYSTPTPNMTHQVELKEKRGERLWEEDLVW